MTPPWRSALFLLWGLTSFAWLFGLGAWMLSHEGEPAHGITFIVGTLWAGIFFVHLISRK